MMSRAWLWGVCCGVMAVAFEGAYATPTTHIWSPSTDVQPFKLWHLTSDFYVPTETVDGVRPATITNFGLTVGVLPFKNLNAEVGVDHKSGTGVDAYPIYFNTKIGIPEDAFGTTLPAFAVGIYDVGTEEDKTNFNVVYAKAAKTLKLDELSLGRFSAGYFAGNPDLLRDGEDKDNHGVLLAWERVMTEITDKLWVCIDYQGTESLYGALNFGFFYKFSDNVSTIFGYDMFNNRDFADTFTVQVDIDF